MSFQPLLVWDDEIQMYVHWDEEGQVILGFWSKEEYETFMEEY